MDKESKLSSAAHASDSNYQKQHQNGPLVRHSTSSPCLVLPNPYVSDQVSQRDQSGLRPQQNTSSTNGARTREDVQKSHGRSSSLCAREASDDLLQRHGSMQDPQKVSKCKTDHPAQGRIMGKKLVDAQKEGKAAIPVPHKECWGATPSSLTPQAHKSPSAWKEPVPDRTASPPRPSSQKSVTDDDLDSPGIPSGQPAGASSRDNSSGPVLMSWNNVAFQPPKKAVPKEKTISNTHMQMMKMATQQEGAASGKKKQKKRKKKAKGGGEDVDTDSEELAIHQEPPKVEDEEEFPGLSLRLKTSSNTAKLCNEENKLYSAAHASASKYQRQHGNAATDRHSKSSPPLALPNSYVSDQISRRNQSGLSPQQNTSSTKGVRTREDVQKSHSSSHRAREASGDLLQRHWSIQDPHKVSKCKNDRPAQGKIMGKNSMDAQKRGFRDTRSAPNSAEPKSTRTNTNTPFEVKIADFPELAPVSPHKSATPVLHKECWGATLSSLTPKSHNSGSAWRDPVPARTASSTRPSSQKSVTGDDPDSPGIPSGQPAVALSQDRSSGPLLMSWTNVVSQPPKKVVPKEKTISSTQMQQLEEMATQQEGAASEKKKRKKRKKKAKAGCEDVDAESEECAIHQEPPKFEDEEEFPGLSSSMSDRLKTSSNTAKLCNEENKKEAFQHPSGNQNKDKSPALKILPTDAVTKGQKAKKVSGKKSKVPIQLDFRNMLTVLEHTQDDKQDAKPVILSVGGGLHVVQKQPSVQKKLPWKQDKIAHNPLDSTSPLVKKGKQREVPKAKKPTPIKKIILKEREERKQRRLLEERGMLPEDESTPVNGTTEEQCDTNVTGPAISSPVVELDEEQKSIDTNQQVREDDGETDKEETEEEQSLSAVPCPGNQCKLHSRKFRDYCSQMLSKEVDGCVTSLLKELVRFQDRLYQKDPMKARMKRRIVMGLREVLKHLKLRKIKCVIISPNCERSQYKGGLDEALHTIMDICCEQGVPFVFALSRKALGRCVNKAVPVSLVGIFNYDGAQDYYHKMIELTSEARKAYELMVSSLEQTDQATDVQEPQSSSLSLEDDTEPGPDTTWAEEPEYMKIWKRMLEKECNHTFLNFEEQLGSIHLTNESAEQTDKDEKS